MSVLEGGRGESLELMNDPRIAAVTITGSSAAGTSAQQICSHRGSRSRRSSEATMPRLSGRTPTCGRQPGSSQPARLSWRVSGALPTVESLWRRAAAIGFWSY